MNTRALLAVLACTAAFHAPTALAADGSPTAVTCGTTAEDRATTRSEALARSQSWLDAQVPYSQDACHENAYGSYRTDCSGYVSMAWGLSHSRTTVTLREVSTAIAHAELMPGDALVNSYHAALFVRWADAAKSEPVVREQTGPDGAPPVERAWRAATAADYTAVRYHRIVEG
ncbi:NlpC/P60 family protein [Saccharothrix hoggarensis]|uniref:Peptidoglycan endopeptidase n=1 Tax=Saccharothrix hoggarensis TaxID=913853 RepID=A0ABW3QSB1_9PSEU